MSRQPRRDEYTVGWVCALPIESAAARILLDERYDAPAREAGERIDDDIYFTGSMAGHNVVIACLPECTGTSTAAALATRMQAKFRGLRFGLMVGIGGGVPSNQEDIRLGDVVVSVPHGIFAGVVQYDKGKTTPTGNIRTGSLDSPPQILLSAVSALRSDTFLGESRLQEILSEIEHKPNFRRPESSADVLYDAACKQVVRPLREKAQVAVHYGTIASGNQVMKSAIERDKISGSLGGVFCFEMEAAGLMNNFPCLIIRGISDYADAHKNDEWQGHAAATAAAFAKELLLKIPPEQVLATTRLGEVVGNKREHDAQPTDASEVTTKRRKTANSSDSRILNEKNEPIRKYRILQRLTKEQKEHLLDSLKSQNMNERENMIKTAHTETCNWLLTSAEYTSWLDSAKIHEHHGFLWIKGKAGSGKSTMMKFIVDKALEEMEDNLVLSFFFNARGSTIEKSTTGAYRSLLLQLLSELPELQNVFETFHWPKSSFNDTPEWSVHSLKVLLDKAIQQLENVSVMCFIDALDECDETEIRDMVQFFEQIGESCFRKRRFLTCFASRHYPHISIDKSLELVLEIQGGHSKDITHYITTKLDIGETKIAQQIRDEIQEKAAGVFMWVVLVIDILNKTYVRGRLHQLQEKLRTIPDRLHDLFYDILTRDSNNKEEVVLCIQWVLFAKHPLSPAQLYHAILSGSMPNAVTACDPDDLPLEVIQRFILDSSKGLAEITGSSCEAVQFIHESVRDFLLKEDGLSKVWHEYKNNFQGQSHESLKRCSENYLSICRESFTKISCLFPDASSQEAKYLFGSVDMHYPLLQYAVDNIFYHADLAESHGVSQANFLDDFDLKLWVWLDDLRHRCDSAMHQSSVSLLYILSELDCANLIHCHLPKGQVIGIEAGQYGCPLFAAAAHANNAAIRALLSALRRVPPGQDVRKLEVEREIELMSINDKTLDFTYVKTKGFMINAALFCPEWLMILLLRSPECTAEYPPSDVQETLFQASFRGHGRVVELLLQDQAISLDSRPRSRHQALRIAARKGHESIAKSLISKGAEIGAIDRHGDNAIHIATRMGFENVVVILLNNRPDLIESTTRYGETPLFLAIGCQHRCIAEILLGRGANTEVQLEGRGNALISASTYGLTSLVMILLDNGADVNAQGGQHGNALQAACCHSFRDIVELLLDKGAEINAQGGGYGSALQAACYEGHRDIIKLLLDKGANVNAQGGHYGNALQAACYYGSRDIVKLLLDKGAEVNAQGGEYRNALQAACFRGSKGIVELLIDEGADINAQGGFYGNALKAALKYGVKDIVELLIARGAKEYS